jgi:malonyl-CoA/methylmalonyl-CoA synthetase
VTLAELFDLSLVGRRDETALLWRGEALTFGDVDAQAARMGQALRVRGLRRGDRVCVYLANSLEYVDLFLAATRLGVIFVPVNVLYRDREIAHIVRDAEPVAVITSGALAEFVPDGACVWMVEELIREAAEMPAERVVEVFDGDEAAAIVYTSGTTGVAKGAVLTHNNFIANAVNIVTCWRFHSSDRLLLALPLFHVHGLGNGLHAWLVSGCVMRLEERFEHARAREWMEEFEPTVFFGVPTMYVRLLEMDTEAARRIGEKMRLFVSGSAPLPAQTLEDFRERFGHTILERYGMSETLMNISNPYAGERRAGSVGVPLPGVSVKIFDAEGREVAAGEVGELHMKGPNLFAGYWRRPEETRAAFRGEWFRTGDIGVRSPDGYYTLQGRRSDLIISGGFNIYPREIEEFLCEQEGVREAAVVGVKDAVRGEVPVAYVVMEEGCGVAGLEEACRAHLASFKLPRRFVELEKLPRTALGKVQKHLLGSS